MLGISESISLIILVAVVLAVSMALFYSTMFVTSTTRTVLEYGQVKSMLKDIAVAKLDDILQGALITYHLNYKTMGIGYRKLDTTITITITQYGGTHYNLSIDSFYTIYGRSSKVILKGRNILYGEPEPLIVNKTDQLPFIVEYNTNAGSVIELSINKILYKVFRASTINGSSLTIRLMIVRIIKPIIHGQYILRVYSILNTTYSETYQNTTYFRIYNNGEFITSSDDLLRSVGIDPADISSFRLEVLVYDIHFELY